VLTWLLLLVFMHAALTQVHWPAGRAGLQQGVYAHPG